MTKTRVRRFALVTALVAFTGCWWFFWSGWWPIGYTPFVRVGTDG